MSPIEAQAERFGPAYKWLATATVMVATIASTATATIVNVALNDIAGAFGLGQDQVQWLSTGFLAAMTASMLLTAWLLERFGYRATFIGALVVFISGCALGSISTSGDEVIAARVLQGLAAGVIQPLAMVVISQVFPLEQRGTAMGVYGVGVVLAPALGPTLGGVMVDQYSWRDVFLVVVPFAVLGMAAAAVILPARSSDAPRASRFDLLGFVLLVVALVAVLTGLSNGQRDGWSSDGILLLFAVAVVSGLGFVLWEWITPNALLRVEVFANARFSAACVVAFALGAGIYGSTYIVPLFVETVQGYTSTRSGLLLMPAGFVLALVFPVAGRLSDRVPARWLIMTGLALFGLSCWLCRAVATDTPFWTLAVWVLIGRIGLGLILPALNAGALWALPRHQLAQGSGTVNFVRQLGGAFGVNLLSILLQRRLVFHGDALAQVVTPANPAVTETLTRLTGALAHWGSPLGERYGQQLPPAALAYLQTVVLPKAQMFAYRDGFYIVAILFFLTIVPAWFMRGRPAT